MEFTSQIIPEVVNNFNVYDASGSVIIGITVLPRRFLSGSFILRS